MSCNLKRKKDIDSDIARKEFALGWKPDMQQYDTINFRGYTASYKISEVTGLQRLYYDHNKAFEKSVKYYDYFKSEKN